MTVVENLVKLLGRQAIATACKVNIAQTHKWGYPRSRGGTDGRIPAKHFAAILDLAKQKGVELDPMLLIQTHIDVPKKTGRRSGQPTPPPEAA